MPEQWAAVPGWPAYEVSTRGRVRSVERRLVDGRKAGGVLLKTARDSDGYRRVTLVDGRRKWSALVHRLVLLAHAGPCPDGMEGCHNNGRPWDNRLANLRWDTKAANRADRERHRRERSARAARAGVTATTAERLRTETPATATCLEEAVSASQGNATSAAGKAVPVSRLVKLSQAHAEGMFGSLTLAGVRIARHRDPSFPDPVRTEGLANLYSRAALARWWRTRR